MKESKETLNQRIKENLTPQQLQDLKDFYVERLVDNMSTKDLVRYVFDDMTDYVDKQSPVEFFDDAYSCLLYTSPSPRDRTRSRMPSSA